MQFTNADKRQFPLPVTLFQLQSGVSYFCSVKFLQRKDGCHFQHFICDETFSRRPSGDIINTITTGKVL